MSSQHFLLFGCGVAGEKNDRIFLFLWILLAENTCKKRSDLQYIICPTANLFLTAGIKFVIPPNNSSDAGA
jgi:hypothetical protein